MNKILSGVISVNKPAGMSSHDVIYKLRRILGMQRIGHAGTLDEMATGVLPVCFGRATRALDYAQADRKVYEATVKLGLTTDTQDIWGTVISERASSVDQDTFSSVLSSFTGEQYQLPPMYSAIKINGSKLYDLARKGIEIERAPRKITIYKIDLISSDIPSQEFKISVLCSKGVYIRTLCSDIGERLGCGAVMSALIRTVNGRFRIENSYTLEQLALLASENRLSECVLPVDIIFDKYPIITADSMTEAKIRNGACVETDAAEGCYRVYSESGEFLALCSVENEILKLIKGFYETGNES